MTTRLLALFSVLVLAFSSATLAGVVVYDKDDSNTFQAQAQFLI